MTGIADATVEIIRADVRAHTSIEWERVESLLAQYDALAARVRELETALLECVEAYHAADSQRTYNAIIAAAALGPTRRDA